MGHLLSKGVVGHYHKSPHPLFKVGHFLLPRVFKGSHDVLPPLKKGGEGDLSDETHPKSSSLKSLQNQKHEDRCRSQPLQRRDWAVFASGDPAEAFGKAGSPSRISMSSKFQGPSRSPCGLDGGPFPALCGIVCLGAVIRETHPILNSSATVVTHGILHAQLQTGLPMAFGVLTTDTVQQAMARAREGRKNKGYEAAKVVIEMIELVKLLKRRRD